MAYLLTRTIVAGGGPVGVAAGRFRDGPLTGSSSSSARAGQAPLSPADAVAAPASSADLVIGYEGHIVLVDSGGENAGAGGGDNVHGGPNASPEPESETAVGGK